MRSLFPEDAKAGTLQAIFSNRRLEIEGDNRFVFNDENAEVVHEGRGGLS